MKRYVTPRSACSSTSRLRIAACTETSSARRRLVADDELRDRRRRRGRSRRAASGRRRAGPASRQVCARRAARESTSSCSRALGLGAAHARPACCSARIRIRPHGVAAVERRVRVLEDDLQRPDVLAAALAGIVGASVRPSSSTVPGSARRCRAGSRASVVLPLPDSPTSPSVSPCQIAALTPTSAWMSWPCCWNDLRRGRRAARAGSRRGRSAAASISAASCAAARERDPGGSSARAWPGPTSVSERLLGAAAVVGERAPVGEDAARIDAPRLGRKPGIVSSRPWSLRTPPRGMQRSRPTV